jgi:hypothetical protein
VTPIERQFLMSMVGEHDISSIRRLLWLRTLLDLCELEAADVVAARGIGGAAEKSGKGLDMPDIVVLCLVAKAMDPQRLMLSDSASFRPFLPLLAGGPFARL